MEDKKCYRCGATEKLKQIKKEYWYFICNTCNNRHQRAYKTRNKKLVFDHYGYICVCCGENNTLFLSIDHIDNDASADKWSNGKRITGWLLYAKIIRDGYPDGYQTLCMNCNWGKRMNEGVCPHKV